MCTCTNIWLWGFYKVYLIFFPTIDDPHADTKESFLVGHIFTSVATSYASDAIQCMLDNSANTHIWSILADFVPGTWRRLLPSAV